MASSLGSSVSRHPLSESQAKLLLSSSAKSGSGSAVVDLHPVVLLHIADHYHRNVAQHGSRSPVFGALLGRQEGPKAELCFAFEIRVHREDNHFILDKDYWLLKEEQFKQVLPNLDYVGWYTVSDEYLNTDDLDLQNQFWEVSQNPFLLKARANKLDSFPADLFESVVEFVAGSPTVKFNPVSYNIVFEQAEQIGVHHLATKADAETSGGNGAETEFEISMRSMSSAVRMLQERLSVISQYMAAVEAGILPPDSAILIELKRIVELLESLDSEEQQDKYNIELDSSRKLPNGRCYVIERVASATLQGLTKSVYFQRTAMEAFGMVVTVRLYSRKELVMLKEEIQDNACQVLKVMKLQAVMTSTVGSYTQTVECLIEFIRKNVVMMERKMHGKGHLRISQGPFPQRGFPKSSKHSRPSNKFTKGFFNRSRGEDSSDGPRSSGSLGESSH